VHIQQLRGVKELAPKYSKKKYIFFFFELRARQQALLGWRHKLARTKLPRAGVRSSHACLSSAFGENPPGRMEYEVAGRGGTS